MSGVVWLASYPKSGNTWLRLLISAFADKGEKLDINEMSERGGIASARGPFDHRLLIDSGLLSHDEIERLRPLLHADVARDWTDEENEERGGLETRFTKVHDAYTLTQDGVPMLGGAQGALGAILIVRDPRDVAPSLANHLHFTIDAAIDFMASPTAAFAQNASAQTIQFRQKLPGWSGHIESWLGQRDIPVHLLRYEDMKRDTAAALKGVLAFAGIAAADDAIAGAVTLTDFARLQEQERDKGFGEWRDRSGAGRTFFRRGEAGSWKSELTPEQALRIEAAHAPMMRRLGYAPSAG
jgi:sulfotransferase family protein